MPGKQLNTSQISEAVALREAGYTLAAIAEQLGVSVSSLQRIYKKHPTKPGVIKAEVVERARDALLERLASDEAIKYEVARLLSDDLAHTNLLRNKAATTLDALTPSDTASAAQTMRALVAYSTIIKNTSDTLRHSLGVRQRGIHDTTALDTLPELTIRVMTDAEIDEIRSKKEPEATGDRSIGSS